MHVVKGYIFRLLRRWTTFPVGDETLFSCYVALGLERGKLCEVKG